MATVPTSQKSLRPANRQRQQSYREHFEQLLIAWQEKYSESDPEATIDDCRDAYFAHLKTYTIEGSCVFHGTQGCELPRDWRADMCNTWICPSLQQLRKNHLLHNKPITIIVATDPGAARRANVVRSESGERIEPEVEILYS